MRIQAGAKVQPAALTTVVRLVEERAAAKSQQPAAESRGDAAAATKGSKHWAKLKRKSTRAKLTSTEFRALIGHDAEHEAAHRFKEKVGFACLEHAMLVGENCLSRAADALRLKRLARAREVPRRAGLLARLFRRRVAAPAASAVGGARALYFEPASVDALVSALPGVGFELIKGLRVVVPACGLYLVSHMCHADWRRAGREWAETRRPSTTLLFYLAALCDALDALVHAVVVVAHADYCRGGHVVSHHALHDLESLGVQLAFAAFCCAVLGEVLSKNTAARRKAKAH